MSKNNKHRKHTSVSVRVPLLVIASFLIVILLTMLMVYNKYEKRTIQQYTAMAKSATMLMTREFDPDKCDRYLEHVF